MYLIPLVEPLGWAKLIVQLELLEWNLYLDYEGTKDSFGKTLRITAIAVADEICSAAELVMGKTLNFPVVIVRNYNYKESSSKINSIIRPENEDLFR